RDNSGAKKRRQPLCRKGFSVICLKMTLKLFCREWSQKKATPATTAIVRGCDHLQKFYFATDNTGDTSMITRQLSRRPAWGDVHAKS
ncbi:hypothetical protein, partial [Klebsiella pneumoniae]|uniref:hypothetical protein n=1 Tax=Klebsiella pneumoniae TaxID=573 RepID=UPI003AAD6AE5